MQSLLYDSLNYKIYFYLWTKWANNRFKLKTYVIIAISFCWRIENILWAGKFFAFVFSCNFQGFCNTGCIYFCPVFRVKINTYKKNSPVFQFSARKKSDMFWTNPFCIIWGIEVLDFFIQPFSFLFYNTFLLVIFL